MRHCTSIGDAGKAWFILMALISVIPSNLVAKLKFHLSRLLHCRFLWRHKNDLHFSLFPVPHFAEITTLLRGWHCYPWLSCYCQVVYPWPYCYWMVLHAKTTRMVWRSPILGAYYAFSKTKCQTQKMLCLLVKYDTFHITLGAILSLPWTWDMGHVENMTVSPPSLWTLVFTCLVHISKPSYLGS